MRTPKIIHRVAIPSTGGWGLRQFSTVAILAIGAASVVARFAACFAFVHKASGIPPHIELSQVFVLVFRSVVNILKSFPARVAARQVAEFLLHFRRYVPSAIPGHVRRGEERE